MIEEFNPGSGEKKQNDSQDINIIRPQKIEDFVGQPEIKKQLRVYIESAKKRGKPIDHILLYGPAGLGKTTLASIIAREMQGNIKVVAAPVFEKNGDLAAVLSSMQYNDVLFIDEIHRLKISLEEVLFPAMEDYKLDILIGKGPSAQTVRINLPHFTLIGATTQAGSISKPLQTRFGIILKLDYYDDLSLQQIIKRAAALLSVKISEQASLSLSRRSRGTPRIALRLLKRIQDYAVYHKMNGIETDLLNKALLDLGIDDLGLEKMDRKILDILINHYDGGPVGLSTLAVSTGEDKRTIEEYYEPFLIQKGLIKRTQKGRVATSKTYEYMDHEKKGLF